MPPAALERHGTHVYVRRPTARDEGRFLRMTRQSQRLHRPWVHPPLTETHFAQYIARFRDPRNVGLLVLSREDESVVGAIHFNEIVRGIFQSCYLGYFGSREHAGRGWMREALGLALHIGFRDLRLHRAEANIQPDNEASLRLVRSLGFRKEGYSPRYLKIGGRWKDHERWAILSEDWKRPRKSRSTQRTAEQRRVRT
ncbi:MAG: GNAT family N-acetyltransferase [Candidatus Eisenbacteria bacterium]